MAGCWIFISHSSSDIEKIRIIRNEFEKYGQNPLAFHLKCLSTETNESREELFGLIKREIAARDWFVYCESGNAEASANVRMERDYVSFLGKKKIWHIDLNNSISSIINQVRIICCDMQVFISYHHADKCLAEGLAQALKEKEYNVWNSENDLSGGYDFKSQIDHAVQSISKEGFVVLIITQRSCSSEFVEAEVRLATKNHARIIALIFNNAISVSDATVKYKTKNAYEIPNIPMQKDFVFLADLIESALKRKIVGATETMADVYNANAVIQEKLNYSHRYHPQSPIHITNLGATSDYCELYKFPCCGKVVLIGDGIPSCSRADGCSVK